ncbi:MAG: CRISPR-associated endonuclease Cas2 [Lachnospiraceae bacterium]
MRVMVFFDLPSVSANDHREYTRFHKHLVKSGFVMMQESVYCKLALNTTASDAIVENIRKNKPIAGLVQVLTVTEKQFSKIEYILGENTSEVLDSDERLVIL